MAEEKKVKKEEVKVSGNRVIETIKNILHEGHVRRLIIKNEEGETVIEVPLTIAAVGVLVAPVWAAIGAFAALVTECTIEVEKEEDEGEEE